MRRDPTGLDDGEHPGDQRGRSEHGDDRTAAALRTGSGSVLRRLQPRDRSGRSRLPRVAALRRRGVGRGHHRCRIDQRGRRSGGRSRRPRRTRHDLGRVVERLVKEDGTGTQVDDVGQTSSADGHRPSATFALVQRVVEDGATTSAGPRLATSGQAGDRSDVLRRIAILEQRAPLEHDRPVEG